MWATVLDWALTLVMFLLNVWLFSSVYRSNEAPAILLFYFIYVLVVHDCLYYSVTFYHDIPSYFQNTSFFKGQSVLLAITIVILACQWFFHLFFLLAFALLHFLAVFSPGCFRRFNIQSTVILILLLYCLTAAIIIPLFTSCCGYMYYPDKKYWFFDYKKPWTEAYQAANSWLQVAVVITMVFSNIAIVAKLYLIRRNLSTTIGTTNSGRGDTDGTWISSTSGSRRGRTFGPEVRLAVSFLLLSGCWLASTLSFNFLMGTDNPFLGFVSGVSTYLNRGKWIVYCLGHKNIRKKFTEPLNLLTYT